MIKSNLTEEQVQLIQRAWRANGTPGCEQPVKSTIAILLGLRLSYLEKLLNWFEENDASDWI
jgi:hypothetical protein